MNSRWFYLLLANIAILATNVYLFTVNAPRVEGPQQSKPFINSPANTLALSHQQRFGISSVDSFHFPLKEPYPSAQENLLPQLKQAQNKIDQKEGEIKTLQQRNSRQFQQVNRLEKQNDKLHQQLFALDEELHELEALLLKQGGVISNLEENQKLTPALQSDIQLMKNAIDQQPDLVKIKPSQDIDVESHSEPLEENRFSGSVEFGFSYEQDNQITKALNGRLILDYAEVDKYKVNSDLKFEFEKEDSELSTEKYRWQLQSDYNLNPTNHLFARSDVSRSKFSSYEKEDIFTLGYGHIVFNSDKQKFNIEIGPGYRFAVPNVGENAISIDEFIVRTRLNYERVLSESLQVSLDAVLEAGHSNSVHSMGFQAQNRIYQSLYLVFNFDYKYTQTVPVDTVNKEIFSGLNLLYAF